MFSPLMPPSTTLLLIYSPKLAGLNLPAVFGWVDAVVPPSLGFSAAQQLLPL
jgi:hypothetical protein